MTTAQFEHLSINCTKHSSKASKGNSFNSVFMVFLIVLDVSEPPFCEGGFRVGEESKGTGSRSIVEMSEIRWVPLHYRGR